jgi:hypothetical protein
METMPAQPNRCHECENRIAKRRRRTVAACSFLTTLLMVAIGGGLADAASAAAAAPPASPAGQSPGVIPASPNPARFRFDQYCVTIDGHDALLFSGAFHYFRCPPALWPDRFRTLKAAGFNTLETYAAWNYHEPTPPAGPDDTSKFEHLDELHDWLAMACDQFGFNVILRPGPYICAEWDGGGYPQWLLTRRPASYQRREWLRSDDPDYLAWCRHWYAAVANVAAPFQITRRPAGKAGILFWQIENEYDYSDQPVDVKRNQLDYLAHLSRDLGIEIPLITCQTENPAFRQDDFLRRNVIDCVNTYPGFDMPAMAKGIDVLDSYQPGLLKMITELQGGWFAQVGGQLSQAQGFDASQINHITLLAWQHGFTVTNYYMGFGGTNFGDWAARGLITSYDYDAPVREPGGVTSRYLAVKALGNFITDHGPALARSTIEQFDATPKPDPDLQVTLRRSVDGSRFLFVLSDQREQGRQGSLTLRTADPDSLTITARYDLPKFGSKILYLPQGASTSNDWYPRAVNPPPRPTQLPPAVTITDAKMQSDPGPRAWKPLAPGQSEEDAGIFNRGFVFYRTTVPPPAAGSSTGTGASLLSFALHSPDWAGVACDGKIIAPDALGEFPVAGGLIGKPLVALYENCGRPNFGTELEQRSGLLDPRFLPPDAAPLPLKDWREQHLPHGQDQKPTTQETADDSAWPAADINAGDGDLQPGESAVYRASIGLSAEQLKCGMALSLGRVDDAGSVYVNGQQVGECDDWSHAQRFEVGSALKAGKNAIAVLVRNRDGAGGLSRGASLIPAGPALPARWEISDQPAGVARQWWKPDLDDSTWQTAHLGDADVATPPAGDQPADSPLLRWYRFNFSLPAAKPHVWVPWKLHLAAVGNGFLYLNGHALGRWWQAGPQTDFYLPECWLNFGPGGANVVALSLRPNGAARLLSARVEPFADQAEQR